MLVLRDVPFTHGILSRYAGGCVRIRGTCRLRCTAGVWEAGRFHGAGSAG